MKSKSLLSLCRASATRTSSVAFAIALASLLASDTASAIPYVWDTNGSTAGFGTITGTWDTGLFWNSDATGGAAGTLIANPTTADTLSVTGGTANGTITLNGTKAVSSLTINPATPRAITVTGGTLALGGTGGSNGIFAGAAQSSATTISSPIAINTVAATAQNTGSGTLSLSGGISGTQNLTLRNNGITLNGLTVSSNITTSGTVTNTGTGTGGTLISGNVGSTVTNLIQNGASTMTLIGFTNAQALTTVTSGILSISSTSALGGASNFSTNGAYSVGNNGTLAVYNAITDAEIATMLGTTNFLTGSSIGFDTTTAARSYTEILANTAQGTLGLSKNGPNTLTLGSANTYTGTTRIRQGSISVSSLNSVAGGTPPLASSSLGAPTTIASGTITLGGTTVASGLIYTGSGETSDRVINLASNTQNTLTQSGTGLLKLTSNFTFTGDNNRTFNLAGSTEGTGELTGSIVNSTATLYTTVNKTGTGKWTLSGAYSFGNPAGNGLNVNGGTLALGAIGTVGATFTTGVTVNSGATLAVTPGVTTTANQSVSNTNIATGFALSVNSGATLTMVDTVTNTFTINGAANLYAGPAAAAPRFQFDLSSTSPSGGPGAPGLADRMAITGPATFANPGAQLFFTALNPLQVGDSFTIATATSGLDSASSWSLGSTQVIFGSTAYSLSLAKTATSTVVTVTGSSPAGAASYYTGDQGTTLNTNNSGDTNWATDLAGSTDSATQPSSLTDVIFTATNATNFTVATLGQDFTFNSLLFNNTTSPVALSDTATNSVTLGGGISMVADALPVTLNIPIVLAASQSLTNASNLGTLTLGGAISGDGGIRKSGSGLVTFAGTNANTFVSPLVITEGILSLNKSPGVTAVPGNLTIGDGLGSALDILQLEAPNQIADTTLISLVGVANSTFDNGLFRLNGQIETIAGLESATGMGIVENGGSADATLTLNPTANRNFRGLIQNGGGGGTLSLTKSGPFTQTLSGGTITNTFTGLTTITGGSLIINKTAATTALAGDVAIGDGSVTPGLDILALSTTANQIADSSTLTFSGSGTDAGTFRLAGNAETINRVISATPGAGVIENDHLTAAATLTLADTVDSTFSGTIQNSGVVTNVGALTLTKSGPATLTLSGTNTYTGATNVSNGTLITGSATTFTNKGSLGLTSSGSFDLNGFNAAFTNLTGNSTGTNLTNSGPADATLNLSAQVTQISARLSDGPTHKLAIQLSNGNSGINLFRLDSANTFSGGITLTGTNTRLRVDSTVPAGQSSTTLVSDGTPGAITSSPFGTGPITIGLASIGATDKASLMFSNLTGSNLVLNDIIFNTALGSDVPGIRAESSALGLVFAGKITANLAPATFAGNGSPTVTGQITGPSGLTTVSATVALTLANPEPLTPNNYLADTVIGATSSLILGQADQIPNGTGKGNVTANGTFDLAGFSETINGLAGTSTGSVNSTTGPATLTLGDNDASATFAGALRSPTGNLTLIKIGSGTQTLSGQNTSIGNILVNAGTLALADNARLTFTTGATTGTGNNTLSGAGTITLAGDFFIDTTASDSASLTDGTWLLENSPSLPGAYSPSFSVVGWADAGNDEWVKVSNGKKYTFSETTGSVSLAPDAFAAWIDSYFPGITDQAIVGPNADPDNDGVKNILEYALNGKPNDSSSLGLQKSVISDSSAPTGDDLTLVIAVLDGSTFTSGPNGTQIASVGGVTYTVQGSADLSTFANTVTQVGTASDTATDLPDLSGSAWEYKTFKLNSSEGLTTSGFLRIGAEAQ